MNLFKPQENPTREIERLKDLIQEQMGTIKALNMALNGEESTSTENLIEAHEVDYAEQGLIPLSRNLTKENVRLLETVEAQKKAWTGDYEEIEQLLADLVEALGKTSWSSWQTTAKFSKQLEAAEAYIAALKEI